MRLSNELMFHRCDRVTQCIKERLEQERVVMHKYGRKTGAGTMRRTSGHLAALTLVAISMHPEWDGRAPSLC